MMYSLLLNFFGDPYECVPNIIWMKSPDKCFYARGYDQMLAEDQINVRYLHKLPNNA